MPHSALSGVGRLHLWCYSLDEMVIKTGQSVAVLNQRPRMAQVLILLLCAGLLVLIGRLVYINTVMGERLRSYSYKRQTSTIVLHGSRRAILDRI